MRRTRVVDVAQVDDRVRRVVRHQIREQRLGVRHPRAPVADHPAALQTVLAAGRQHDTVFVGARAPSGAMAWLPRPIQPITQCSQMAMS